MRDPPQLRVGDAIEQRAHREPVVTRVVDELVVFAQAHPVRHLVRLHEVGFTQRGRIERERECDAVDHPLAEERRLALRRAPVGARRRLAREHALRVDLKPGPAVGPRKVVHGELRKQKTAVRPRVGPWLMNSFALNASS